MGCSYVSNSQAIEGGNVRVDNEYRSTLQLFSLGQTTKGRPAQVNSRSQARSFALLRLCGPFMQVGLGELRRRLRRDTLKVELDALRHDGCRALYTTPTHTERPAKHAQDTHSKHPYQAGCFRERARQ